MQSFVVDSRLGAIWQSSPDSDVFRTPVWSNAGNLAKVARGAMLAIPKSRKNMQCCSGTYGPQRRGCTIVQQFTSSVAMAEPQSFELKQQYWP